MLIKILIQVFIKIPGVTVLKITIFPVHLTGKRINN